MCKNTYEEGFMALIKCPECGKEISDKARACVNCGCPISENIEEKKEDNEKKFEHLKERQEAEKTFSSEVRKINYVKDKPSFWKRGWFLALMCIFIPPIGLCLLWVAKKPRYAPVRMALSVFLVIYAIVWCVAMFGGSDDSEKQPATDQILEDNSAKDEERQGEEAQKEPEEQKRNDESTKGDGGSKEDAPEDKFSFSDELKEYEMGNYPYITKKDLAMYYANMSGVPFCTLINIDKIDEGKIQSAINGGFMMSSFNTVKDYSGVLKEDEAVAVIGTVDGYSSYGFVGESLSFSDCMVIAAGDDAKKFEQEKSDKSLKKYFEVTKEVIASGVEVSEDEYKGVCEELNYEEILRNPDSFDGSICKISGKVSQIVEGFLNTFTIYIEDKNGDIWGCTYSYKDGESRLLEGDSVTVYGECGGTDTTTTVLGKQVTMPRIDVEYIN